MMPQIDGFTETGFGPVADAFAANFETAGELGANVTVYAGGRPVVDLWAGVADANSGRRWDPATVVCVFSCSKGVMATLVNLLVQEGKIELDQPVAVYWPEFAAAGKERISVRLLLSHQAGLAAIDGDFTLQEALSWDPIVEALAAEAPQWEPGSSHGYHMRSFGWLTGELVRRVTGLQPAEVLRARIVKPLGLSLWLGMPSDEQSRCARLVPPDDTGIDFAAIFGSASLQARVFTGPSNLFHYDEMWNTPEIRAAVIPSSGMISDARALARMYAACVGEVDGKRLLHADTVKEAATPHAVGTDAILSLPMDFGLGYIVGSSLPPECPDGSFGHAGAGGSLGFADPVNEVGFGYVMNRMRLDLEDRRAADLAAAVYRCLG
jgi:CubicO group peptidase (beta-lactamase class C family)